ncbi:threonine ammonia-lyase [Rhodoligotrophos defluvii]|uniref:threonine ammonia-lyase n=1 Tax=Rhodoligotrophos defluvii TaxID=2561934 RepID=UPI0010C9B7DA|nr:threonine/serine dehydratase [Rhodoligotrophos defluvii]
MSIEEVQLPRYEDVAAAARRLRGRAVRTPLLGTPSLDDKLGFRLRIKAETLQRTGSFKFRGAFNRISQIDRAQNPGGVVAYSSGNHGQGVAAAAALCGLPAVVVMPADSPQIKLRNTAGYGAEVVTFDRAKEDREVIAARIAHDRKAVIVPPYDDPAIIAGQGTAGLEVAEQAKAAELAIDHLVAPVSGGGLIAGIALAMEQLSRGTKLWTAEPAQFDDHARSLAAGRREQNAALSGSICDALMARSPGVLTFAINQPRLAGGLVVSDDEVRDAMAVAFDVLKLVIEPGGAVALAAVLTGKLDIAAGETVVVVASGGNVDRRSFAEALAAGGSL